MIAAFFVLFIVVSFYNIARGFNHGKRIGKTHCVPLVETTGYV